MAPRIEKSRASKVLGLWRLARARGTIVVVCAGVLHVPAMLSAQTTPAPIARAEALLAAIPDLAVTVSDTGRMTRGYHDWTRYTQPGMCVAAVIRVRDQLWHHFERDTMYQRRDRDTLPTVAIAVARACGARFTVAGTDPAELYDLMRLSLMMGNDAQAQAVVERQLSLAKTIEEKSGVLYDAAMWYSVAMPIRRAPMHAMAQRLVALGPAALKARILYTAAAREYEPDDTIPTAVVEAEMQVGAAHARLLPPELQIPPVLYEVARSMRNYDGVIRKFREPDSVRAAMVAIGRNSLRRDSTWVHVPAVLEGLRNAYEGIIPTIWEHGIQSMGKPVKANPTFWYNTQGQSVSPVPGKVTLYYYDTERYDMKGGAGEHRTGGSLVYEGGRIQKLLRLYQKYAAAGLDVTLLTQTTGSAFSGPPLTGQQEADVCAWYFLEQLKLPFRLGVFATKRGQDQIGRVGPLPTEWQEKYGNGWFALVGRDGRARLIGDMLNGIGDLDALIAQELARPVATSAETADNH